MPDAPFAGAALSLFQYGEFVNKANRPQSLAGVSLCSSPLRMSIKYLQMSLVICAKAMLARVSKLTANTVSADK